MEIVGSFESEVQGNNVTTVLLKDNQSAATANENGIELTRTGVTWTKASILKLIQLHKEYQYLFEDSHYKKKSVWEILAKSMQKEGFSYTWAQVENKWKSLTKKYRDAVDHNAKHGHICSRKSPFFTELSLVYKYTSPLANQDTLATNLLDDTDTSDKTLIDKNDQMHQQIVSVVTHLPQQSSTGCKRKFVDTSLTANSSFPITTSLILKKKKKYGHPSSNADKESDVNQILHMLRVMNEDRKKQECQRMKKLEKMHQEKIAMFNEFLTVLKTSISQGKLKDCQCRCSCESSDR